MEQATRTLAYTVKQMRSAQQEYFIEIAKARKSKEGKDFARAAMALKSSKSLEALVDQDVDKILSQ